MLYKPLLNAATVGTLTITDKPTVAIASTKLQCRGRDAARKVSSASAARRTQVLEALGIVGNTPALRRVNAVKTDALAGDLDGIAVDNRSAALDWSWQGPIQFDTAS
ncbi:hypothetical protein [Mesorhizobium sp. M00.F.Ca.ET.216.01.1.1]|uniref:hypothetical protein n=1 Tax=Mesorhizobium sp. M00.F.Ca.ET.216.01.1.1 TaxID=2500528 RepID=UPI001FDFD6F4|nr:hypothetical protein [Mesorhizobium sp. M00.F.Ca.ET.216.01.1.1]